MHSFREGFIEDLLIIKYHERSKGYKNNDPFFFPRESVKWERWTLHYTYHSMLSTTKIGMGTQRMAIKVKLRVDFLVCI